MFFFLLFVLSLVSFLHIRRRVYSVNLVTWLVFVFVLFVYVCLFLSFSRSIPFRWVCFFFVYHFCFVVCFVVAFVTGLFFRALVLNRVSILKGFPCLGNEFHFWDPVLVLSRRSWDFRTGFSLCPSFCK